jgi:hypothetical protein
MAEGAEKRQRGGLRRLAILTSRAALFQIKPSTLGGTGLIMKKTLCGFLAGLLTFASVTAIAAPRIESAEYSASKAFLLQSSGILLNEDNPMLSVADADAPAIAKSYMPLREVLERIGYRVDWDEKNGNVLLSANISIQSDSEDPAERYDFYLDRLTNPPPGAEWIHYSGISGKPGAPIIHVEEEFCDVIVFEDADWASPPPRWSYANLNFVVLSKITGNPRVMFRWMENIGEDDAREMYRFSNDGKTMHYGYEFCYELDLATDKLSYTEQNW